MTQDDFRNTEKLKISAVVEKALNGWCCSPGAVLQCADRAARVLANQDIYIPPCQIGDIVYRVSDGVKICEYKVIGFMVRKYCAFLIVTEAYTKPENSSAKIICTDLIGKTVFLTLQTAKKHLIKEVGNDS